MFEPQPFIRLNQTLSDAQVEAAMKELYEVGKWSNFASAKLASNKRRTAIIKRFPAVPVNTFGAYYAPKEWMNRCIKTPNYNLLTTCVSIIDWVMQENGWTKLGIALVSELEPGGTIPTHSDDGEYFDSMHRVQIPLNYDDGCVFNIGDETKVLGRGEVWIIDNRRKHSVHNNGKVNRVNLYFDAI